MIPEESARHYRLVPLKVAQGILDVGMIDPTDIDAREALQFISSKLNMPFKIFVISLSDFKLVLEEYKGIGGEVTKVLGELEAAIEDEIKSAKKTISLEDSAIVEDAPITKMVAVMLKHATEGGASDIHIEPGPHKLRVRFRVDGVLHTSLLLDMKVHSALVSRIKILTNMRLDEQRRPQDGRFSTTIGNRGIDFRVSTFPTPFGEKVAIRILDPEKGIKTFEDLGIDGRNLEVIKESLKRPYGMILVTGPTGSGKTTTLYAILQILNQERSNIVSLEDPIEYNIEGVNQSQVRPEIGYTFANGLRSILRQDPDIIMVGEIRDKETAQLAIHAALTGHLVLSTLHTNNAVGVIPRLVDMGVDPYLISPTLILAVAQRLVRTLCADSKRPVDVTGRLKESIDKDLSSAPEEIRKKVKMPKQIYQALPSPKCPKGTSGRIGVFEMIAMTNELEKIILTNPTPAAIMKEARNQGMMSMREDGILKVLQGRVGLEELSEVV